MKRNDLDSSFLWGVATAAYQIEGAAFEDNKGPNIWDLFSHQRGKIFNNDTGDIACDHYHRSSEDLRLLHSLGVNSYRFSLSWSRLIPEGTGSLNPMGVGFYDRLIDQLLDLGIQPCVTLYHWDLPQTLQDRGGWEHPDVCHWFSDYASEIFALFGDRVECWFTHNEPWVVAYAGHYQGRHAPGKTDLKTAVQVSHHLLKSHSLAVQTFRASNAKEQGIGIVLNLYPISSFDLNPENEVAAGLANSFFNRWFLDPLYKSEYPENLMDHYRNLGIAPTIGEDDLKDIAADPGDFLGMNYYFRKIITKGRENSDLPFLQFIPENAWRTDMGWEVWPHGLEDLTAWLVTEYDIPSLYVTENGAAFPDKIIEDDIIQDEDRRTYLQQHIASVINAARKYPQLKGYFVWSLMDNFEWARGYSMRFGLFGVDYSSQKRFWKLSGQWYRNFLQNEAEVTALENRNTNVDPGRGSAEENQVL